MHKQPGLLDLKTFNLIVRHTPLISIDLIILNEENKVMLGWRKNQPAKNHWFVPGGRILKNETIYHAFERIAYSELGISLMFSQAEFMGVYEHIHRTENFSGDEGYGTHYIVLAFRVRISGTGNDFPVDQHSSYQWFTIQDLLLDPLVHGYAKNYFNETLPVR